MTEEDLEFRLELREPNQNPIPGYLDCSGERLGTDLYEDMRDFSPEKYVYISWQLEEDKEVWYVETPHRKKRKLTPEEFKIDIDTNGDYRFPFSSLKNPEMEARILREQADFILEKNKHLRAIGDSAVG